MQTRNRQPAIVGVIGPIGAGKDEIGRLLQQIMYQKRIFTISYSMILKEALKKQGKPATREALQRLGTKISKRRQRWLEEKMRNHILRQQSDTCVIAGLRTQKDVNLARSFARNIVVAVHTDPRIRYKRVKMRKKLGDGKTRQTFLFQGRSPIERRVSKLMRQADIHINNNGTLEDLQETVHQSVALKLLEMIG